MLRIIGLALCVFFLILVFSSFSYRYFVPFYFFWSQASISLITICFWIFNVLHNSTSISVSFISLTGVSFPFKTFLVLFRLCARFSGQLVCQFSSADHASYHIMCCLTSMIQSFPQPVFGGLAAPVYICALEVCVMMMMMMIWQFAS